MAKGYYNPKTFHNGQALKQHVELEQFRDQIKQRDAEIDKLSEKERKNYYNELEAAQDDGGEPDEDTRKTLKEWAAADKAFKDAEKKQIIDGLEINKDYTGLRKTGLKKGGKVKAPKKFSRGGGIEVRGKTKGRFV